MNIVQLVRPVQPVPVRINPVLSDLQKRLELLNAAVRKVREMGYRLVGEKIGHDEQRPAIEIGRQSLAQLAPLISHTKGFVLRVKDGVRYGHAVLDGVTVMWEEL